MSTDTSKPAAAPDKPSEEKDDVADAAASLLLGMAQMFMRPFPPFNPPPSGNPAAARGAAAAAATSSSPAPDTKDVMQTERFSHQTYVPTESMIHRTGDTWFDSKFTVTSRPPSDPNYIDGYVSIRPVPFSNGAGWSGMSRNEINRVIQCLERARDRAYPLPDDKPRAKP